MGRIVDLVVSGYLIVIVASIKSVWGLAARLVMCQETCLVARLEFHTSAPSLGFAPLDFNITINPRAAVKSQRWLENGACRKILAEATIAWRLRTFANVIGRLFNEALGTAVLATLASVAATSDNGDIVEHVA